MRSTPARKNAMPWKPWGVVLACPSRASGSRCRRRWRRPASPPARAMPRTRRLRWSSASSATTSAASTGNGAPSYDEFFLSPLLRRGAARQQAGEIVACVALGLLDDGLGRALGHDAAAAGAAIGAEIEHPVGGLDDFEIVLDHHHRVAALDQAVQHFEQLAHVFEMQARGRLVENVEGATGGAARQFLREIYA